MKIDHEFLSIGYIQKKSAVYTQNTGILSDFSLIMGIADPFLLYIPKTQENQGVCGYTAAVSLPYAQSAIFQYLMMSDALCQSSCCEKLLNPNIIMEDL